MPHSPFTTSILFLLTVMVGLGAFGMERAFAAADPDDRGSIDAGAQLYDMYCSECHGVGANGRYGELDESGQVNVREEYPELIEIVRVLGAPERDLVPVEDWPEWSENPAPLVERETDVRAEVMDAMTGAIDKVPDSDMDIDDLEPWGDETDEIMRDEILEQMPVATNLADPSAYFYGTSEQDLFKSIASGTGSAMHDWRTELGSDESIWDLVNYIRSQWEEQWLYQ